MSKQEFNTGIHDLDTILDHLVGAGYNDDKFYFADRQSLLNDIRDLERTAELYHINIEFNKTVDQDLIKDKYSIKSHRMNDVLNTIRLITMTMDRDKDYITFEGNMSAGNNGTGTVYLRIFFITADVNGKESKEPVGYLELSNIL